MNTPPIPKEVVEYLKRVFPDRMPPVEDSIDSIRVAQGNAQVVRHLEFLYEEQNEFKPE